MKLHDAEKEKPFLATFDARFPYDDKEAASSLIHKGALISLNACCCVLNEICRPPKSTDVSGERLHQLLAEWSKAFEHELKETLIQCAKALIDDHPVPQDQAADFMTYIGEYDAQRAGLGIAYFSSACLEDESDLVLEDLDANIRSKWDEMGI